MIKRTIYNSLVVIIFLFFGSLLINKSEKIKNIIYSNIYDSYLNIAGIKKIYGQ